MALGKRLCCYTQICILSSQVCGLLGYEGLVSELAHTTRGPFLSGEPNVNCHLTTGSGVQERAGVCAGCVSKEED